MKNKHNLNFYKNYQYYVLLIFILLSIFVLSFRLNSVMPGLSNIELGTLRQNLTFNYLIHNPLNLIINLIRFMVIHILHTQSIFRLRLANLILGYLSIMVFFLALKFWYGNKTALLGIGMFISSPWVINVSRIATNDVQSLFGISLLLLISGLLRKKFKSPIIYIVINFILSILIFIPGLIWFVLVLIIFQRKDFHFGLKSQNKFSLPFYIILSILSLPLLVIYLIKSSQNILNFLGLSLKHINIISKLKDLGLAIDHSFLFGPNNPSLWLGRYPILNIFGLVCVIIGIYFYILHFKNNNSKLLFSILIIGLVLLALNKSNSLSLSLPTIYFFIATGISYLLQIWLKLFPINPLARSIGIILIIILISLSVLLNTRQYFVAFANNPRSRSSFEIRLKD